MGVCKLRGSWPANQHAPAVPGAALSLQTVLSTRPGWQEQALPARSRGGAGSVWSGSCCPRTALRGLGGAVVLSPDLQGRPASNLRSVLMFSRGGLLDSGPWLPLPPPRCSRKKQTAVLSVAQRGHWQKRSRARGGLTDCPLAVPGEQAWRTVLAGGACTLPGNAHPAGSGPGLAGPHLVSPYASTTSADTCACRPPLKEGACLGKQRRGREGSASTDHPHWTRVPGGEEMSSVRQRLR